ncbi:hypothetical protein QBC33DRAFT_475977, partial [Phialemonium atrogriseum]
LLNQPLDILFEISEFLPPESVAALSLTCKSAFYVLFPVSKSSLHDSSLENLLLLLEKDLRRHFFYCYCCLRLHRFSSYWAPCQRYLRHLDLPCRPEVGWVSSRPSREECALLWPGRGLRLSQLEFEIRPSVNGWVIKSSARIIEDVLFLSFLHTLVLRGTPHHNRDVLEYLHHHHICHHITTHRPTVNHWGKLPTRIPELSPWDGRGPFSYIKQCWSAPGSCLVCLTDFTTTIERRPVHLAKKPGQELWTITILSYHQVGHCRSPLGCKWDTVATGQPS